MSYDLRFTMKYFWLRVYLQRFESDMGTDMHLFVKRAIEMNGLKGGKRLLFFDRVALLERCERTFPDYQLPRENPDTRKSTKTANHSITLNDMHSVRGTHFVVHVVHAEPNDYSSCLEI